MDSVLKGWRLIAGLAGVAGLAGPATAAAAPSATVAQACVVNTGSVSNVVVSGAGWTPGDPIDFRASHGWYPNPANDQAVTVGAGGTFSATLNGFVPAGKGGRPLTTPATIELVASDDAVSPAATATAPVRFANLYVTAPAQKVPYSKHLVFTRKGAWSFSGFLPGTPIYGHYLHKGRLIATARFGRAAGACGTLKTKALLFPGGHPRYAAYNVQFDDARRYSKTTVPRLPTKLTFTEVF